MDRYVKFIPNTRISSVTEAGTSGQERQHKDFKVDIQNILEECVDHPQIGDRIFLNPLVDLVNDTANRKVDQGEEPPSHNPMMGEGKEKLDIFQFPIRETSELGSMKNINLSSLPNFHGLITKDLNTLLFELEVVCRTYYYSSDAQNIKLFTSSIKDSSLRWLMSLDGNISTSWKKMKKQFIEKYRNYCKARDTRDKIFRMVQGENESLED